MTRQQKTDLRVCMAGVVGILGILPFIEWDTVRPAAIASVMMMVGIFVGLVVAVVLWGANNDGA